jgi:hypothetical protein
MKEFPTDKQFRLIRLMERTRNGINCDKGITFIRLSEYFLMCTVPFPPTELLSGAGKVSGSVCRRGLTTRARQHYFGVGPASIIYEPG